MKKDIIKTQTIEGTKHFISAYTILFLLIILVAGLTWILPAGKYDYKTESGDIIKASVVNSYTGGETLTPIAGTYTKLNKNPQGVLDVLTAPIKGFYNGVDIILFVLVIGGFLKLVTITGAIDAGIARVTRKLKGKEIYLIPILMILFALGGTTYGMGEELVPFYLLIIPVLIAAGFDALVGAAILLLGAGIGVVASTVNPFATGIASGFAEVPLGDGIGLRLILLVLGLFLCIHYVMKYAKSVKEDPKNSLIYNMRLSNREYFLKKDSTSNFPELTGKRKFVLWLFGLTFLIMVYGVIPFSDLGITMIPTLGWWFTELTVLFLTSSILIGLFYKMPEESFTNNFVIGAKDLLGVALIIGIARGITVIMNQGLITDTILSYSETAVTGLSSVVFINVAYWLHIALSFFIPSSSGLATFSMPIMAPLAGFAGVSKALIVTAFQTASGMVNLITPTSVILMGGLAISRISYNIWFKFVMPLLIQLTILIMIILSIGVFI